MVVFVVVVVVVVLEEVVVVDSDRGDAHDVQFVAHDAHVMHGD